MKIALKGMEFTSAGELKISTNTTNKYQLTNKDTVIDKIGTFAEVVVAKIQAGLIETRKLVVGGWFTP